MVTLPISYTPGTDQGIPVTYTHIPCDECKDLEAARDPVTGWPISQ
jgi:hypothetical protein